MSQESHTTIMEDYSENLMVDLLFYWLASLPLLCAVMIWLHFWRKKQLLKKLTRSESYLASLSSQFRRSFSGGSGGDDKPPPYTIYTSFPIVHSYKFNKLPEDDDFYIDDLSLAPPTYDEAIEVIVRSIHHDPIS